MSSGYKGNKRRSFLQSFGFAIEGIIHSIKYERNLKFHIIMAAIVIVLGIVLQLTSIEWLFIVIAIGGMFTLELINTALERIVDLVTKDYHHLAKEAKDIAAGAVLIFAIVSVVIGCIIFLPKLF